MPLSKRETDNHLKKPPGIDVSQQMFQVGQKEIAKASWQNRNRNMSDPSQDPLRRLLLNGISGLNEEVNSAVPPYFLPVSISEHTPLKEWEDLMRVMPHQQALNQQLPCISGDWTASGTPDFMKRLQFGVNGKDYVSKMGKGWIEAICKCFSYLWYLYLDQARTDCSNCLRCSLRRHQNPKLSTGKILIPIRS